MPLLYILFAFSSLLDKANRYLLPCPFKYLSGYECPGCGFQRSLLALLKGNFQESFHLYPSTVPLLITVAVSFMVRRWFPAQSNIVIKTLFLITASMMMISYGIKIFMPHPHVPAI